MIFSRRYCKSQDHRFSKWVKTTKRFERKCKICGYMDYENIELYAMTNTPERDNMKTLIDIAIKNGAIPSDKADDPFTKYALDEAQLLATFNAWQAQLSSEPLRMFPMQNPNIPIPWAIAEVLYSAYSAVFGTTQSLERMAERGGFGWGEISLIIQDYPKGKHALNKHLAEHPLPKFYLSPQPSHAIAEYIKRLENAIKFYADKSSYDCDHDIGMEVSHRVILYKDQYQHNETTYYAGKRAIEALASKPTGLE